MDLGGLTSQLGFPIAIAVWFVYQNKQLTDKYIEEGKRTIVILEKATEVMERNTEAFKKLMEAFESRNAK